MDMEVDQLKVTSTTPPADSGFYKIDETTMGVVGDLKFRHPKTGAMSSALTVTSNSAQGVVLSGDGLDYMRYGYDVVVVLVGQSNADSRGAVASDEPTAYGPLLYRKDETVVALIEPAGVTGYPNSKWINNTPARFDSATRDALAIAAGHSAAQSFGREFQRLTGLRPLIVPCAIGSTAFSDWTPPAVEDDPTTLFGAATMRARKALRPGVPLILWLVGHESAASSNNWNLSTGAPSTIYTPDFSTYIYNWRMRFPDAWLLYGQLSAHATAATMTNFSAAADEQRRLETAFNTAAPSGAYGPAVRVDTSGLTIQGTNATNTVTVSDNSIRLVSDLGAAPGFLCQTVRAGKTYRLTVVSTGTGLFKLSANSQKGTSYGPGTVQIVFTADTANPETNPTTRLQFFRAAACDLTFDLTRMTLEEDVSNTTHPRKVMFVEHDLSRNAGVDGIHLSAAGQDMLGVRAARAAAQRIVGISDINGTGPRLVSVTKPSSTTVKVKFNKTIQTSATGYGAALATSLFRVYDAGAEKTLTDCSRDPVDDTAVLITLSSAASGVVVVTYGDRPGPSDTSMRAGCVYDTDGLPAPMFMQAAT